MRKLTPEMEEASAEIIEARAITKQMRIRHDSEELRTLQTLLDRALMALNSPNPPDKGSR